jgi:hypothetical protein
MTTTLPKHTLMTTFLTARLRERRITVEHLADLLQPLSEATVHSWISGWSSPAPSELSRLAEALHINPVELVAGWLIDKAVVPEAIMRAAVLEPLGSSFPRSDTLDLIAPRKRPSMTVEDPHDEREPERTLRCRAPGLRKVSAVHRHREARRPAE